MSRAAVTPVRSSRASSGSRYLEESEGPLHSLVFVLPLIIAYEIWIYLQPQERIVAFGLVQSLFRALRAPALYLTPLAIVAILLACQIAKGGSWRVRPSTVGVMAVEGFCWGAALLLLCVLTTDSMPSQDPSINLRARLLASVGAGLYEELVFRLAAMTALSMILTDALKLRRSIAIPLIVVVPAVGFGLYHYLGIEQQTVHILFFRCLAGIYFGLLFYVRGFGITVGAHISYDVIFFLLQWFPRH